jgi:Tfp pilus assembly protein PilF
LGARARRGSELTRSDELAFDRALDSAVLDGVEVVDDGLSRPELVTPNTVIKAGARNGLNPTLVGAFALALLSIAGLGVYAYYYYAHLPPAPTLPSPRVLDTINAPAAAPPLTPKDTEPVVVLAPPAPVLPAAAGGSADTDQTLGIQAEMQALAAKAEVALPPSPPTAPDARDRAPSSGLDTPLTADTEITTGEVRIARAPRRSKQASLALTRAYAAFVAGDLVAAERGYQRVFAIAPKSRDAGLGLASIALAKGDLKTAHRYYTLVLEQDPTNATAVAGNALIEGSRADAATESKLQGLLERGTDAPYLHFALGNLYARSNRWPDAQQAFFEAFRGNPQNADYAFNLAVSLEHLGQASAALEYYRRAQTLAVTGSPAFTPSVLAQRITALEAKTQ